MAKKWIQSINMKSGAFTAQAKRAGMGVQAFARHVLANKGRYSAATVRRARLALVLTKLSKKRRK